MAHLVSPYGTAMVSQQSNCEAEVFLAYRCNLHGDIVTTRQMIASFDSQSFSGFSGIYQLYSRQSWGQRRESTPEMDDWQQRGAVWCRRTGSRGLRSTLTDARVSCTAFSISAGGEMRAHSQARVSKVSSSSWVNRIRLSEPSLSPSCRSQNDVLYAAHLQYRPLYSAWLGRQPAWSLCLV